MIKNRTKIIATLGPNCSDSKILSSMIDRGVNCFRVNLSHGNQENKKSYFDLIKSVTGLSKESRPSILADLAGPKVRVRKLDNPIVLEKGQTIVISSGERTEGVVPISKNLVFKNVDPESRIMINDGKICLKVIL